MVMSGSEVGQTEEVCVHDINRCMCDDQNEKKRERRLKTLEINCLFLRLGLVFPCFLFKT